MAHGALSCRYPEPMTSHVLAPAPASARTAANDTLALHSTRFQQHAVLHIRRLLKTYSEQPIAVDIDPSDGRRALELADAGALVLALGPHLPELRDAPNGRGGVTYLRARADQLPMLNLPRARLICLRQTLDRLSSVEAMRLLIHLRTCAAERQCRLLLSVAAVQFAGKPRMPAPRFSFDRRRSKTGPNEAVDLLCGFEASEIAGVVAATGWRVRRLWAEAGEINVLASTDTAERPICQADG